jgi:hypothetical protein
VIFEPLDFIAWLATLVPKSRFNLTRFRDVFAPNSKHRGGVTPARRADEPATPAGQQQRLFMSGVVVEQKTLIMRPDSCVIG